ncbi:hypothetical protein [Streptomyces cinereoruber]|uniref:hypothetical protein n=1 Tax=Streptomyces cinereoruber TaxID=67260 RepID=UPI003625644B
MRRYHYILTLQLPTRTGVALQTWTSTADVPPGMGRQAVYKDLLRQCTAGDPEWARANVLFWSLEPDDLAPADEPAALVPPADTSLTDRLPRQRG